MGEIKVWKCDLDDMSVSLLASTNIDCRPTCLSLLDKSQCGTSQQSTPTLSIEKQQAARLAARIEALESLKPRSYVAIEYDENDDGNDVNDESEYETSEAETEPSISDSDETYDNDEDFDQEEDEDEPERLTSKKKQPQAKPKDGSSTKRKQDAPKQTHSKRAKK